MKESSEKSISGDPLVKLIFDHLRNLIIACGVVVAGAWVSSNPRDGWESYWDGFAAFALIFVGIFLLAINQIDLTRQLKTHSWSRWIQIGFIVFYAVAVGAITRYLAKEA